MTGRNRYTGVSATAVNAGDHREHDLTAESPRCFGQLAGQSLADVAFDGTAAAASAATASDRSAMNTGAPPSWNALAAVAEDRRDLIA
jgi:hypothetical protein